MADREHAPTLPANLQLQAATRGGRPAVIGKARGVWRPTSWASLLAETEQAAAAMARLGVGPGDHVVFAGATAMGVPFFPLILAVQWCGGVPVLLPDVAGNQALRANADLIRTKLMLVSAESLGAIEREVVSGSAPIVVVGGSGARLPSRTVHEHPVREFDDLLRAARESERISLSADRIDAAAAIVFDATLRAQVVNHRNILDAAAELADRYRLGPQDRQFEIVPRTWRTGLVAGLGVALVSGSAIGIGEQQATLVEDFRQFGPVFAIAPPAFFQHLRRHLYQKYAGAGPWSRRLIERSVHLIGTVPVEHTARLGAAIIRDAVRDAIGLSRLRIAIGLGEPPPRGLDGFMASLRLPLANESIELGHEAAAESRALDPLCAIETALADSLFVRRALLIITPGGVLSTLVRPDVAAVSAWSRATGTAIGNLEALPDHPAVLTLIAREIAAFNASFKARSDRQIQHFLLTLDGLSIDSGDLAHDGTLRRDQAMTKHAEEVTRLRTGDGFSVEVWAARSWSAGSHQDATSAAAPRPETAPRTASEAA